MSNNNKLTIKYDETEEKIVLEYKDLEIKYKGFETISYDAVTNKIKIGPNRTIAEFRIGKNTKVEEGYRIKSRYDEFTKLTYYSVDIDYKYY